MVTQQERAETQLEVQQEAPRRLSLAEKIAEDTDSHVEDMPTSPGAIPSRSGRSRRARLGVIVSTIPYV